MESADVKRLALVLAVQAEIDGMKAENIKRENEGRSAAYGVVKFSNKANELRDLAYVNDMQL